MTNKTFTIVGVSTLGRVTKTRFANGSVQSRAKVLTRNGHTDVKLFELPQAMSKDDARAWLEQKFAAQGAAAPAAKAEKVAVAA